MIIENLLAELVIAMVLAAAVRGLAGAGTSAVDLHCPVGRWPTPLGAHSGAEQQGGGGHQMSAGCCEFQLQQHVDLLQLTDTTVYEQDAR